MEREIDIVISGRPGCGKTTVGMLIKEALESRGFRVKLKDQDYSFSNIHEIAKMQKAVASSDLSNSTVNIQVLNGSRT